MSLPFLATFFESYPTLFLFTLFIVWILQRESERAKRQAFDETKRVANRRPIPQCHYTHCPACGASAGKCVCPSERIKIGQRRGVSEPRIPFDWGYLLGLRGYPDLGRFACSLKQLGDDFYQLDRDVYARTELSFSPEPPDPDAELYAGLFFWAPSDGAAIRSALWDASRDDGETKRPPDVLLPDGWRWSYRDILEWAERGNVQFRALSRHPTRRVIAVGLFSYHFRADSGDDDKAYAVEVDVRGMRWALFD